MIGEINKIKSQKREIFSYPDQNLIEENLLMMEKYILETKEILNWGEIEVSETFSEVEHIQIELKSAGVGTIEVP